jgi:hypothetical protein
MVTAVADREADRVTNDGHTLRLTVARADLLAGTLRR